MALRALRGRRFARLQLQSWPLGMKQIQVHTMGYKWDINYLMTYKLHMGFPVLLPHI
jgi:hypothetical protein